MPYVISDGGKSWRWVEAVDVKGGETTSETVPTMPSEAPKFPQLDVATLQQLLRRKGVISDQEIVDAARGVFP